MKHAAEVLENVYCYKKSSPSGLWYHFSRTGHPPKLIRITKIFWHESATEYTFLGERRKRVFGQEVTIWKTGWRFIRGARNTARQKRKAS